MSKRQIIFLILLVAAFALLYCYKMGAPPLFEEDEAKITEEAREILTTGDWVTLHLNGQPWFHKPPLYMWLTAATFAFFGVTEFTARIWSVLFSLGSILVTFFIGRILYDEETAELAGIVLGSSLLFIVLGRTAFVDGALTFFIALSILLFLIGYKQENKKYCLMLSAASMALATMAKGPLGIILPGLSILIYLLIRRDLDFFRSGLKEMIWSLIIYIVIAGPWWAAETMFFGTRFLHDLFGDFMVGIYTSTFQKHSGPIYFYILVILAGMLPWSFHVLSGVWQAFKKDERASSLLLISWSVVVLVIFSTAKTKVPGYILPIFPALSLLAARSYSKGKIAPRLVALPLLISVIFVMAASEFILPAAEIYFPSRMLAAEVNKRVAGDSVTYYNYRTWFRASLVFYLKKELIAIKDGKDLLKILKSGKKAVIFTDIKTYDKNAKELLPLTNFVSIKGDLVAFARVP